MQRIVDFDSLKAGVVPPEIRKSWTAIIPAAGQGTRLRSTEPKLLYPLLGKPIIEWLVELLSPLCEHLVFVLSPSGEPRVRDKLKSLLGDRAAMVIQPSPTGMADAINFTREAVNTPYSLVLWGDQVVVRSETIRQGMNLHLSQNNMALTLPTVLCDRPYIHFQRDQDQRICGVLQAREGDSMPEHGEADCGLFLFTTSILFQRLREMNGPQAPVGARTREHNFLSLIPLFDQSPWQTQTLRLSNVEETLGVNTPEDARRAEAILSAREIHS